MEENLTTQKTEVSLTQNSLNYLSEIGKWSMFFAILGFIGIALMIIVGFFAGTIFSALPESSEMPIPGFLFGLIYIVLGGVYYLPMKYLYNFASKISAAVRTKEAPLLEESLMNLKAHYKFMGIMYIVVFSLYIFIAIGAVVASLFI